MASICLHAVNITYTPRDRRRCLNDDVVGLTLTYASFPPTPSLSLSHFVITIYGTKHKAQKSLDLTPLEKQRGQKGERECTAVQVERVCCLWGVALAIGGNISLAVDFNTSRAAASSILAAVQRFPGTQRAAPGEARRQEGETISLCPGSVSRPGQLLPWGNGC